MSFLARRVRRFAASVAASSRAEKIVLTVVSAALVWTVVGVYILNEIMLGRLPPLMWPLKSARLREAQRLLKPFASFVDEHAAQRRRLLTPGWRVLEKCRRPLDVLFLVHSSPRHWRHRVLLRHTMFEPIVERYFNWTAVFFTHEDRSRPSPVAASLDFESAKLGDLVDLFLSSDQVLRASRQRVIRNALAALEVIRWAFRNCPRARHVVEMADDVIAVSPFMLARYLRQYVDPAKRIIACQVSRKKQRMNVRRRGRVASPTWESSFARAIDFCANPTGVRKPTDPASVVVMTGPALRAIYTESLVAARRRVDDAYVTGDLARAAGVSHVDFAEAGDAFVHHDGRSLNYTVTFMRLPDNLKLVGKKWWESFTGYHVKRLEGALRRRGP